MIYIKALSNLAVILISIRATCKVLDMRSNTIFAASIIALMMASIFNGPFEVLNVIRLLVIGPLSTFVLPVAMSRGPMQTRITRTLLLATATMCTEFAAAGTYGLLTGSKAFPTEADTSALVPFTLTYMTCVLFSFIAMEGVIAFCRRDDEGLDISLRTPLLALVIFTYFTGEAVSTRMHAMQNYMTLALVGVFVIDLLTLAIALVTFDLARRELLARRRAADQAALVRQARHLKSEVLSIASSSAATRRLRHDLANQVDVIDELLGEGRMGAAEQYLSELQRRAQALADD